MDLHAHTANGSIRALRSSFFFFCETITEFSVRKSNIDYRYNHDYIGTPSVVQCPLYVIAVLAETHSCSSQIRGSSACDPSVSNAWPNSNRVHPPSFIILCSMLCFSCSLLSIKKQKENKRHCSSILPYGFKVRMSNELTTFCSLFMSLSASSSGYPLLYICMTVVLHSIPSLR
jgi:hypothetical protein